MTEEKINKTLERLKKIRNMLDCDNGVGTISCENCPFQPIEHCKEFRRNIDLIRKYKDIK